MLKEKIEQAIKKFAQGDLKTNALDFFKVLAYQSNKTRSVDLEVFLPKLDKNKALVSQWQSSCLLFQITDNEIQNTIYIFQSTEIDNSESIIISYIFAAIELKELGFNS